MLLACRGEYAGKRTQVKLEPDQALCSCFRLPVICNSVLDLVVVLEPNAVICV